jgi:hypothetical protein
MSRPAIMSKLQLAFVSLVIGVTLLACSNDTDQPPASETPAATSEPTANVSWPGQVRASIEASCRSNALATEIEVRYSARAENGARLSRVRLIVDGAVAEDSGPLNQTEFRKIATVTGEPGGRHSYQVTAEAPNSAPASVRSVIQCPRAPGGQI